MKFRRWGMPCGIAHLELHQSFNEVILRYIRGMYSCCPFRSICLNPAATFTQRSTTPVRLVHGKMFWSPFYLGYISHSSAYFSDTVLGCVNKPQLNLTHRGWVTHICVGNLAIIVSDNGLSSRRRQAIIWTEPMLPYCQLDTKEHSTVQFYLRFKMFHWTKCTWKCRLRNGGHHVSASMC